MKRFFYSNGAEKFGPVSFEELKAVEINHDTLIWNEGLSSWERAGKLPDLKEILELIPPRRLR